MVEDAVLADVLIPVHSALPFLKNCINSLYSLGNPKEFNLILVDDNSNDQTKEFLSHCEKNNWAEVYHTPGQAFFTRTVNMGLFHSKAPYVILMNSDILVLHRSWLQDLIECAERWHAGIVGCKLLNEDGTISHAGAYGAGFHYGSNQQNNDYFEEREIPWVTGALMLIRRAVIDTIGFLDSRYIHVGSDRDYCERARSYGFKIIYSPITMVHYNEKSKDIEAGRVIETQHRIGLF